MQKRSESLKATRFEGQPHSLKHESSQPQFMKKELDGAESDLRDSKRVEDPAGMVAHPDLSKPARKGRNKAVKCMNTKG